MTEFQWRLRSGRKVSSLSNDSNANLMKIPKVPKVYQTFWNALGEKETLYATSPQVAHFGMLIAVLVCTWPCLSFLSSKHLSAAWH